MENTNKTTSASSGSHLDHLDEFESVLANYHVGATAQRILAEIRLAILTGPTSSGRDTIINKLLETGYYNCIVSDTTRPPRTNNGKLEQNGVEYWFRSEDEFLADLKDGGYLEAELVHQQQIYGTSVRELKRVHDNHKIAVTDVDIGGARHIVAAKPDTAAILVLPPSYDEWQRRLLGRGAMSAEEYRRRAETALEIFQAPLNLDFFKIVINDDLDDAVRQVDAIVRTGIIDPAMQAKGKRLAQELYERTKESLE